MKRPKLPVEFVEFVKTITAKRPKAVISHILKYGYVTTEEIAGMGYEHAPRAARDVREAGVPLVTYTVKNAGGKSIAAYRFGNPADIQRDRIGGRTTISKLFRESLVALQGSRCALCLGSFEEQRYLQVDHRVPYEISGDTTTGQRDLARYMLICGPCNRSKSWSCEHCENWINLHDISICTNCYRAEPTHYVHVAMREARRLDIIWSGDEVADYDAMRVWSDAAGAQMPDYVKASLKARFTGNRRPGKGPK